MWINPNHFCYLKWKNSASVARVWPECWEGRRLKGPVGSQTTPSVVQAPGSHPHLNTQDLSILKIHTRPGQRRVFAGPLVLIQVKRSIRNKVSTNRDFVPNFYSKAPNLQQGGQLARKELAGQTSWTTFLQRTCNSNNCFYLKYTQL